MLYAVIAASAIAFAPPASLHHATAVRSPAAVTMSVGRREALFGVAAAAVAATPLAAHADGASSKAVLERARAIYGSRVFRLQSAAPAVVLDEVNCFTLFTTGAYRSAADKETVSKLKALTKQITKAAKAGDGAATTAGIKEFVAVGKIRELDTIKGGNFDPTQRRNPGAPPTSEIEAQMGPSAYALYKPLKN
mmetsp:Transcript_19279/g.49320  ORF Transcript_19279/g.49320 Transcript_19279/m.49320 type:complete len:193 (+) Transcript_19279:31-609(+)|eukprot:CAMPEP_0115853696 /NCGR_PEP_ID=MMETSP0287-20121206/13638_1 /TAXON_ID=412157 /ORGANISM="Chrysochromulina rotalis, Strain UIO044" /LENGTH=192 /DNA_ID=CAMNT_0003307783 /DNA_START=82 /DNA_END=660 /DNA_ORIENTATION=-